MLYSDILERGLRYLLRFSSNCRIKYIKFVWELQKVAHRKQLIVSENVTCFVPVRLDGRGKVVIGEGSMLGLPLAPRLGNGEMLLQARNTGAQIKIGNNVSFSNNVAIVANEQINIGDKCLIGDLVLIMDSDFHEINPDKRHAGSGFSAPIYIGTNVWLGSRVIIKKGVNIGDNSIVAAGSVVSGLIPANCIAAGNPAVAIRTISDIR